MDIFTLDDVRRILRASGGDSGAIDGEILDITFDDLGYDSLAMLEFASRVAEEFEVAMPDEAIGEIPTPRSAITYINGRIEIVA